MSLKDVKLELDEIELQQQGLEKQGVRLEQLIRSKCESGSRINGNYVYHLCMIFIYVSKYNMIFYIYIYADYLFHAVVSFTRKEIARGL